ncbi:FCD domain-containing protein [Arthrobacter ipis]|uniref:FCD domain-containing protein n=1 Tax=Arthrobacter ipis TaxID=2716202 RepID=UPI001FE9FBEC|nr:FCD domain-containing protein [Arthrobacter ipis]
MRPYTSDGGSAGKDLTCRKSFAAALKWQWLAERLLAYFTSGDIAVGTRLPTERTLAASLEADAAFHREIAVSSGNQVLRELLQSIRSLLRIWVDRALTDEGDAAR